MRHNTNEMRINKRWNKKDMRNCWDAGMVETKNKTNTIYKHNIATFHQYADTTADSWA